MKKNIILIIALTISLAVTAQKVTKIEVTTSADVITTLNSCKEAGKKNRFGAKDFDETTGKVTLWKNYGNEGKILTISITTERLKDLTKIVFTLPHLPANIDSYPRYIKNVIKKLDLPNMIVGEYFTDIE